MRRPALWSALCLAAGIGLEIVFKWPLEPLLWFCGIFCCAAGIGIWCYWHSGIANLLVAIVLGSIGALRCAQGFDRDVSHFEQFLPKDETVVKIDGTIESEPENIDDDYRAVYSVRQIVVRDTAWSVSGKALIRFKDGMFVPRYGEQVKLQLALYRPGLPRNPGAFDYRSFLQRRGISALGTVKKSDQVIYRGGIRNDWWRVVILPIRRHIRQAIVRNLSGGPAGLLMGVLLGEKQAVTKEVKEAFARTGVNHVLAVSGLHVGLIGGAVFFALKMIGVGRWLTAGITIFALVMYALVTGMPPSVIRASTMGGVVLVGTAIERDVDGMNILGVAGLGLLLARPLDLMDVGFQLSFVATGGILIFYRPLRDLVPVVSGGRWDSWVVGPLSVSLAAQLTTLPFIVGYFGLVSVIGILANLIVVPLIGFGVGLGLLTVLSFAIWEPLTTILNASNWLVLSGAISCAEILAQPDWAAYEVSQPPWFVYGSYLCLMPLLHPGLRRVCGAYVLMACLGIANVGVWQGILFRPAALEIYFLDVGQGDATFLKYPNGRTMLVDGGIRTQHIDMGERVVLPFLRSQGIAHIDVVVGSHPHADHIGGLISVMERMSVGHYLDAGQHTESFTSKRLKAVVSKKGIVHHAVTAGDSLLGLGGLVLHPSSMYVSESGPAPDGLNNGSVVIRVIHEGVSVLLTGDIEHETDYTLKGWGERLKADVLKAAHHGSRTSSTGEFLQLVDPEIVTVSCGVKNKFKHPSPEVIARYRDRGMQIWRTDQSGAIVMRVAKGGTVTRGWIGN